ncbi:dihydroorotase family protein [Lacinutrix iliipiscaria]|uniref:Dihydroorotase family protein n=1 Tax=Lacinutrix iliipiscaria TaxID=1230532 RepID=A0ABW5WN94_9FLAO
MNVLLKSATIIDSKSEFHNTVQDILIEKGVIVKIAKNIKNTDNYKEIKRDNLHVSQGWFDSSVCFGEPGFEERDTIKNGLQTAAVSGFTAVAMNANTQPTLDTSSDISFVNTKAQNHAVQLLPIGALTKASKGEHISEMFDMTNAGAHAFYDYKKPIANANVLKIALQYANNFDGLICSYPQDNSISRQGVVNEHKTSTTLGLKGNPNLAEALQVSRDLFLLEYTNGKLHIPTISTAEAVGLIREAKKKSLNVTCSVAIHNLFFTDDVLTHFDTNFKVLPPLRVKKDVDALIEGVKDGTIDMVTSDHNPLNIELKNIEFDYASYGTVGLESAFSALNTLFSLKQSISILTRGKERFGIENSSISVGNKANATLFNPNEKYTFTTSHLNSKSKNSIFLNSELKGQVYGIIANNKLIIK